MELGAIVAKKGNLPGDFNWDVCGCFFDAVKVESEGGDFMCED
jgi:hypothetical protein